MYHFLFGFDPPFLAASFPGDFYSGTGLSPAAAGFAPPFGLPPPLIVQLTN